ncbi:MAG TPA: hypothetical protein VK489_00285 [Ferruginibacter sp.]|nr:hypothetical protein [Ferruginibacter sp.]
MNIRKLSTSIALMAFIFIMQGCKKEKACRTCYATSNGYTVAEKQACSTEEENEFKATYYYATTSCK